MATKRKKTAKKPMVTEAKFLKLKTELDKYRTTTQALVLELSKLMKEMNEREASRTATIEEAPRPFVSEGPVPVTDSTPATADTAALNSALTRPASIRPADTSPPIADDEVLS